MCIRDRQSISPEQCAVQIAPDGSCATLYALGQTPTGWRTRPDEPWNWMQPGETVNLGHRTQRGGARTCAHASAPSRKVAHVPRHFEPRSAADHKITMDYNYPEQAVYKLADGKQASMDGPCWQYVKQYQQGGSQYGQQQQYGQPQGGYGGQQQGGYY